MIPKTDKKREQLQIFCMDDIYMETCEDIRQTTGMKDLYSQRKQTIERFFGTAKENHGFRYTQMFGKTRMEMKVGLTFACLNLKKPAKIMQIRDDKYMKYFWFLRYKLKFGGYKKDKVLSCQRSALFVYSLKYPPTLPVDIYFNN